MKKELLVQLMEVSPKTVYNYEKENRKIIVLLKKYFNDEDILEFLETGKITKCENILQSQEQTTLLQSYLIDQAIFTAKRGLQSIFDRNIVDSLWNKPAKDILIETIEKIDKNDETYTIDNSKDRLIDKIEEAEMNWLKNPAKASRKELLSTFLKKYFSKIEIYAMIKYSDKTFDYIGYFGKSKKPKRD